MLKTIALAGIFFFASAISTTAATAGQRAPEHRSAFKAPTAPQPAGWCPIGMKC